MAALLGSFFVSFFVRVGNFILEEEGEVRVNSFSSFLCWRGRQFQITGRRPLGFKILVFLATRFFPWFLLSFFRLGWVGIFKLEEQHLWSC
jgi:hypothetical protein